eukprot:GILI01026702.1.p1 GENE.GILI01026702.1~~GILI01026702.1.p1  ORF type:complete len:481 (-),score=88.71 GILI01026702.1:749-2002(-)
MPPSSPSPLGHHNPFLSPRSPIHLNPPSQNPKFQRPHTARAVISRSAEGTIPKSPVSQPSATSPIYGSSAPTGSFKTDPAESIPSPSEISPRRSVFAKIRRSSLLASQVFLAQAKGEAAGGENASQLVSEIQMLAEALGEMVLGAGPAADPQKKTQTESLLASIQSLAKTFAEEDPQVADAKLFLQDYANGVSSNSNLEQWLDEIERRSDIQGGIIQNMNTLVSYLPNSLRFSVPYDEMSHKETQTDETFLPNASSGDPNVENFRACAATPVSGLLATLKGSSPKYSLKMLLRILADLLGNKLAVDALDDKDQAPRQFFSEFLYDHFLKEYGLKSLADERLKELLGTCHFYESVHPRCSSFLRFVGIDCASALSLECLNTYLLALIVAVAAETAITLLSSPPRRPRAFYMCSKSSSL